MEKSMQKAVIPPEIITKREFMRKYYFPVKYHDYVADCALGLSRKRQHIFVWLYKKLPKRLEFPKKYGELEIKTEIIKTY